MPDDLWVKGEKDMIQRILDNFLVNACKYTKAGSIKLLLWMDPPVNQRATLYFAVEDTGIGIAPDVVHKLFQPFFQIDSSYTRSFQGAGLGLAICRKMADLMEGSIQLRSEQGQGSRFTFTVPLEIVPAPISARSPAKRQLRFHQPCRALIVDDSYENLLLTQKFLENFGATHVSAGNGAEAVDWCRKERFDVVLMDLAMPVMDGLEATRRIRAESVFTEVPIIALTADVTTRARQLSRDNGINGFIGKPVRPQELFRCISDLLRQKRK